MSLGVEGLEWWRKSDWKLADEGLERSGCWMGLLFTCTLKVSKMITGLETEKLQVTIVFCWGVERESWSDTDEGVNISLEWLSLRKGDGGARGWLGTAGSRHEHPACLPR